MILLFPNLSIVLMNDGKKSAARKIIYGAFDIIEEKTKKTGLGSF